MSVPTVRDAPRECRRTLGGVDALPRLRSDVERFLDRHGIDQATRDDVTLVTHELACNGLQHGLPPVVVHLRLTTDRVEVRVMDQGSGHDERRARIRRAQGFGRGLPIVSVLCDDVTFYSRRPGYEVVAHLSIGG